MAKQRLLETQEELSAEVAEKANNVHELAEEIGAKLARAEELGAESQVEESMKLMAEVNIVEYIECAFKYGVYLYILPQRVLKSRKWGTRLK